MPRGEGYGKKMKSGSKTRRKKKSTSTRKHKSTSTRKPRKLSAYNKFMAKEMRGGKMTMREAAAKWRRHKRM